MSDEDAIAFKIVLVGDAKVGKTSLLGCWAKGEFSEFYEPTVSPELTTRVAAVDGKSLRLQVWDTGFGDADLVAQFPHFARNAAGAMLMYDLSDAGSLEGVTHWYEQVRSLTSAACVIVLVGCKADLRSAPGVEQKADILCQSLGIAHLPTSAETGRNVVEVFETLARDMFMQGQARNRGSDVQLPPKLAPPEAQLPSHVAQSLMNMPTTQLEPIKSDDGPYPGRPAESRVKLVLLGESGVGKSCLAQRLSGDEAASLSEDYIPTAGPEMLTRTAIVNGAPVRLQIWDAPGNDLLQNMKICLPVLRGVDAVIVLYDVTVRSTFDSISQWFQLLEAHAGPEVAVLLVGSKADDVIHRAVSTEEGRQCAAMLRVPYMEFSARETSGLAYLLDTLLAGNRPPPSWSGAHAVPEKPDKKQLLHQALSEEPVPTVTSTTSTDLESSPGQWQPSHGAAGEPDDAVARVVARARARVEAGLRGMSLQDDGDDVMSVAGSVASSRATRSTLEDKRPMDRLSMATQKASRPQEPRQSEPLPKAQARGNDFPALQQPMMNPSRERSEVDVPQWAQAADAGRAPRLDMVERRAHDQSPKSEQPQGLPTMQQRTPAAARQPAGTPPRSPTAASTPAQPIDFELRPKEEVDFIDSDKALAQLRKRLENAGKALNERAPLRSNQAVSVQVETLSRTQKQSDPVRNSEAMVASAGSIHVKAGRGPLMSGSGMYPLGTHGSPQPPKAPGGSLAVPFQPRQQSPPATSPSTGSGSLALPASRFGGSANVQQPKNGLQSSLAPLPNNRVVRAVSPIRPGAGPGSLRSAVSPQAVPYRRAGATTPLSASALPGRQGPPMPVAPSSPRNSTNKPPGPQSGIVWRPQ